MRCLQGDIGTGITGRGNEPSGAPRQVRRCPRARLSWNPMLSPSFPQRAPWGTADKLRAWQREALEEYFRADKRDFLVATTPGAGKTTFALTLAVELLRTNEVNRVIVVAPTEHLKTQW